MTTPSFISAGKIGLLLSFGTFAAHAELPSLSEAPWIGFFAGLDSKNHRFGISARGAINVNPWHKKGEPHAYHFIPVTWGVERTLPDGKVVFLEADQETLESDDAATDELESTVIRATTKGGAKVELTVSADRGVMSFKVKLLDPGPLPADAIRPVICTMVQNYYATTKQKLERENKGDEFLELLEKTKDSLELTLVDRSTKEFDFIEEVTLASPQVSGEGVTEAVVDIRYIDHTYVFQATGASVIAVDNGEYDALNAGFKMVWRPDVAKDTRNEATLDISVK